MEKNPALTIFRVLRHAETKSMTDAQLRKATGLHQIQIDLGAEELEAEGMLTVERAYTLQE
jgi:F0F1-type ATP synthase beta subunit